MTAISSSSVQIKKLLNRRGCIRISTEIIEQARNGGPEELAWWAAIFQHFVVVGTEYSYAGHWVSYIGYHEQFDEIDGFQMTPPLYDCSMQKRVDECGVIHFEATMRRSKSN